MSTTRTEKCPICGKLASSKHKPFCGQSCRDRDLLQWLGEGYRIPAPLDDPDALPRGLDSDEHAD